MNLAGRTWLVLRAEAARTLRLRSTWWTLAGIAALSGLRAFVSFGGEVVERGGSDPVSSGTAWGPLVDGWSLGLVLGTLVLLVHAARSVAADAESGVLRLAVTRGATRAAVALGRLALAPALVALVVATSGGAAWAVAAASGDFGPFVEDGYEILSAEELSTELWRGVRAVLPAMLATYAFGLLVSCVVRGTAWAQGAALGAFLAFDLFKGALGESHYWVFAAHAPTPADTSAWSELGGVARGFSDAGFPVELAQVGLEVSAVALLAFTVAGCFALRRRPL